MNIFDLAFFIGCFPFWFCSLYFFKKCSNTFDIAKNANHFLHALLFVSLYRLETYLDIKYLILMSIGFYTYDLLYILYIIAFQREKPFKHLPFIVHHVIANYGLYLAFTAYMTAHILYLYYLLEFSNFMLYTSYYVSKRWPKYKNLQLVSFSFQFVWYSYFRVVRYALYMYKIWTIFLTVTHYVMVANALLFAMGLFWSYKLFRKCLKELKVIDVVEKSKSS